MNYLLYFIPITCQPLHIATIYEVITIISDLRLLTDHYLRRGEEEGRRRAGGGEGGGGAGGTQTGYGRDAGGTRGGRGEDGAKGQGQ